MTKRRTLPGKNTDSRYVEIHNNLLELFPQLYARLVDPEEFTGLRIYVRQDATYMGVLKGYSSDGSPMVCFGTSFDVVGCLMALEGSIAANSWRPDIPWEERNS